MKDKISYSRLIPLLVITAVVLSIPLSFYPGSNVWDRVGTTFEIVDSQRLDIDRWVHKTNDGANFGGHRYSDKGLGSSLLGAPSYLVFKSIVERIKGMPARDYEFYRSARHFIRITSLLPLILIAAFLMTAYLSKQKVDSIWIAPAWIFGTVAFPFSLLLFGHQYAAALLIIGFCCLYKYKTEPEQRESWAMPVLSGLLIGMAIYTEYPTAIIALFLGLYYLTFERSIKRIALFGLFGAVLPATAILLFNWLTFGNPLKMPYATPSSDIFTKQMESGFFGISAPKLGALYEITFSPSSGLFFTGPWLLFAVLGLLFMIVRKGQRVEGILFTLIIASYFAFNAGYWEPGGAMSFGPRHLVPMTPFLALAAYYGGMSLGGKTKSAFLAFVTFSVIITAFGTFANPTMPDRLLNPIFEFAFPVMSKGYGLKSIIGLSGILLFLLFLAAMGLMLPVAGLGKKRPSPLTNLQEENREIGSKLNSAAVSPKKIKRERKKTGKSKRKKRKSAIFNANWYFATLTLFVLGYLFIVPYIAKTDIGIKYQVLGNYYMERGAENTLGGKVIIQKDALDLAQKYYKKASKVRRDPYLLYYRAKALLYMERYSEAGFELERVLEMKPDFPQRQWIINALDKIPYGK